MDAVGQTICNHYNRAEHLTLLVNENGDHTTFSDDILSRLAYKFGFHDHCHHQRHAYDLAGKLAYLIEAGASDFGAVKVRRSGV